MMTTQDILMSVIIKVLVESNFKSRCWRQ